MEVYLYNSTVCRLCGEENDNGTLLYTNEEYNQELSETINTYLPLKVSDDGQLPRTICPGCTIQVEATVEFFNLIIKGQKILRDLHEREVEYKKSITKEIPDTEVIAEKIVYEINTSDGIYHVEHPISLQMAGLDKPKRKRGRPSKKLKTPEELAREAAAAVAAKEEEARQQAQRAQEECHGKRRRKMPTRLKGAVQGRELEKIFIEEGVIDKAEGDPDAAAAEDGASTEPEVKTIGHVASSGEPVVVNVRKGRGRPKGAVRGAGQPSQCALCGLRFASVGRYMSHVASHNRDPLFDPEEKESRPSGPMPVEMKEDPEERRNERADVADVEEPRPPTDPAREDGEEEPSGADRKQFECNQCDKKFGSKQSKSMHIKAVHRGERPYRCPECGLSFAYPRSLALHALAHRRRRAAADTGYACDVCHKVCERESSSRARAGLASDLGPSRRPQVLSHPSSVTYHKQAAHGATQYVCGQCGKRFHHRQLLQRHQLVHSKRRPFDCEICAATFKTKANLRNHLQLHSGVKKFSCEVCPQRFSHQTSLTLHMRWHTGSKPYSCETCGKRFSQKGNLSEHERIHTGEKPFACPLCPRRFTTSSQRRLHARRHGNENLRRPGAPRLVPERPTAPAPEAPSDVAFPVGEKVMLVSKQEVGGDVIYVTYEASDASSFRVVRPREVRPATRAAPESAALSARVLETCSQAAEAEETEEAEVENSEVPAARESSAESPVDRLDSLAIPQVGISASRVKVDRSIRSKPAGPVRRSRQATRPAVPLCACACETAPCSPSPRSTERLCRYGTDRISRSGRVRDKHDLIVCSDPDARRPGDSGGGERVRRGRGGRGGERGGAGRARGRRGGTRSVLHHRVDGREARDGGRPRDNRFVDVIFNYKL
ncbi:zinc finger and BTB domain-containing protein 24-like isoform X7 [Pieris napi]|uniref:zinc finger and BTB domain-containing protein 24-like isoform X7 n=1 Tax=Pieris napi TaxID=78633 RepID=UPI001FB9BA3E|nr:zinc finger and BTB domain-containing protein 24-like isoform X7 [Pieris napi]